MSQEKITHLNSLLNNDELLHKYTHKRYAEFLKAKIMSSEVMLGDYQKLNEMYSTRRKFLFLTVRYAMTSISVGPTNLFLDCLEYWYS